MEEPPMKRLKNDVDDKVSLPDLPHEVCLMIFQQLHQQDLISLSETCRRLRDVSRDSLLWKELSIDSQVFRSHQSSINAFTNQLDAVECFKITNTLMEPVPESVLFQILMKFKHSIKKLVLTDEVSISSSSVERLKRLENLECLELPGSQVSKGSLLALGKLSQLQEIRLPSCTKIDSSDLIQFFKSTSNLRVVDISDCGTAVNTKVISTLTEHNRNLEELVVDESDNIKPASLKPIAENCPKLRHLSLEGCDSISDGSMVNLINKCPEIRFLSLGMCRGISCKVLKAISANLAKLEHLDVYACSFIREKAVESVLEQCTNLKYFNLRGIPLSTQFIDKQQEKHKNVDIVFYQKPRAERSRNRRRDS